MGPDFAGNEAMSMVHGDTYDDVRRALNDDAQSRHGRNGNGNGIRAAWLEVLKLLLAAFVAGGSAYLSMDHRLTAVETELRSLKDGMADVKQTLGIGVYQGSKR